MTDIDIHQKQDPAFVEKQWKKWQDENNINEVEDVDETDLKKLIEEMKLHEEEHSKYFEKEINKSVFEKFSIFMSINTI